MAFEMVLDVDSVLRQQDNEIVACFNESARIERRFQP